MPLTNEIALLQFKGSIQEKNQVHCDTQSLSSLEQDHGIDFVNRIQHLETSLRVNVAEQKYDDALENALKVQENVPKSYHGYYRTAQMYLIQKGFDKAFLAFHQGHKHVEQKEEFELLRKSVRETLHIFDHAAVEFGKASKFDKANRIAVMIIRLAPDSSKGYIRAGELYEMQGKSGKATEIYDLGIENVTSECQTLLMERKTSLQQRIGCVPYYNFMTQMPHEIVSNILQRLDTIDVTHCMDVCKAWEKQILEIPEVWRVVNTDYKATKSLSDLHTIKPFVQSISTSSMDPEFKKLLVSIGNGDFVNLKSLELGSWTFSGFQDECMQIFTAVHLTSANFAVYGTSTFNLKRILRSFPSLERLVYRVIRLDTFYLLDELPTEPTSITYLEFGGSPLKIIDHFNDYDYFLPHIPIFPNLVYLYLPHCEPGNLPAIIDGLIHLRYLLISESHELSKEGPHRQVTLPGLQHLILRGVFNPADIANIISQKSSTLETVILELFGVDNHCKHRCIDTNWNTNIAKLNSLVLKEFDFSTDYHWPIDTWIGHCPSLENVAFRKIDYLKDSVFESLEKLPNLQQLTLQNCQGITSDGLTTFFNNLRNVKDAGGSQLRSLNIEKMPALDSISLISILSLKSLQALHIYRCQSLGNTVLQELPETIFCESQLKYLTYFITSPSSVQGIERLILQLNCLQKLAIRVSSIPVYSASYYPITAAASTAMNLSVLQWTASQGHIIRDEWLDGNVDGARLLLDFDRKNLPCIELVPASDSLAYDHCRVIL